MGSIAQLFGRSSTRTVDLKLVGQNAFASIQHGIEGRLVRIGAAAGNDLILAHRRRLGAARDHSAHAEKLLYP